MTQYTEWELLKLFRMFSPDNRIGDLGSFQRFVASNILICISPKSPFVKYIGKKAATYVEYMECNNIQA